MATFELRNAVEGVKNATDRNARLLKKVICTIGDNAGGDASAANQVLNTDKLNQILIELQVIRQVKNIRLTSIADDKIPLGAVSYKVTNLGPNGDGTGLLDFIFEGVTIPSVVQYISGTLNSNDIYNEMIYKVNGNQLFIEYTTY